ncbi:MAG: hypothetical protein JRN52_14840 [Nitrososphaerota archaeon]|nr:hypothetical protein [Nitrososphaerota archaeon]
MTETITSNLNDSGTLDIGPAHHKHLKGWIAEYVARVYVIEKLMKKLNEKHNVVLGHIPTVYAQSFEFRLPTLVNNLFGILRPCQGGVMVSPNDVLTIHEFLDRGKWLFTQFERQLSPWPPQEKIYFLPPSDLEKQCIAVLQGYRPDFLFVGFKTEKMTLTANFERRDVAIESERLTPEKVYFFEVKSSDKIASRSFTPNQRKVRALTKDTADIEMCVINIPVDIQTSFVYSLLSQIPTRS